MISSAPWQLQALASMLIAGAAVVVAPGVLCAAGFVWWAWRQGWPASRLRNVVLGLAFASLFPIVGVQDPIWQYHLMEQAFQKAFEHDWFRALSLSAGAELLPASVLAWVWWWRHTYHMTSGAALIAGERHEKRQRLHRQRAARRRVKQEPTPMSRSGEVVLGHRYEDTFAEPLTFGEQLRFRHRPWVTISRERLKLHLAVIAQTGAGKTELLKRLSAGWTEAAWSAYGSRSSQSIPGSTVTAEEFYRRPRPLTIFVEAKGGREAGDQARVWADAMEAIGVHPARVGVFPTEQRLNMWRMPAKQLRASLHALAATDNHFYQVLQRGLLHLVVDAPRHGPPRSSVQFLRRLQADNLREEWRGHPVEEQAIETLTAGRAGGPSPLGSDLLLFDDLFRKLGGDFDAGRPLSDFDALYVTLPGTVDRVVAEAKAAVLLELLAYELASSNREVLFVLDEFSAVSGEVAGQVTNLVERLRSLGGSVIVSSQSYQGLAGSDDERERLLNAMGGGMLVGRTQGAEPLSKRSGTRKVGEVGRKLEHGHLHAEEATLRRQDAFLLDPNRVRQLPEYHVAYVLPEHVQWGVVTPLEPTKRLPSKAIVRHPQRALPVAGDAVPFLQLRKEQEEILFPPPGGWSQ